MLNSINWLERKKASLCILLSLCVISLNIIFFNENNNGSTESEVLSVTIRHYGYDANEMERTIAIPMEDAVSYIPGVINIKSFIENNMVRLYVYFTEKSTNNYDALRDAVQKIYENLPSSVQRPQINNSDSSRIPVWSAVVSSDDNNRDSFLNIDKIIKPKLESIEGVGEVIVSGIGINEIVIVLDQEKLSVLGLSVTTIAGYLSMNDSLFPACNFKQGNEEISVIVDARSGFGEKSDYNNIRNIIIPYGDGKYIELSEIATVTEKERRPDSYSRINGKKAVGISVMAGPNVNLSKLSENINKEIESFSSSLEFNITIDLGKEESSALNSVLFAALIGAIMVAIIGFISNRNRINNSNGNGKYASLFCAISVPVSCLISTAVIIISGQVINGLILAGLSVGIGTAVDSIIICSEKLKYCHNYHNAKHNLKLIFSQLLASSATTIVALLPIVLARNGDASIIAISIIISNIVVLILSVILFPPLILWNINTNNIKFKNHCITRKSKMIIFISRKINRFIAINARICTNHPLVFVIIGILFTAIGIFVLFGIKIESNNYYNGNSIYAHIEFDDNLIAEETDYLLAGLAEKIVKINGINIVETCGKTGSGYMLISIDNNIISNITARKYIKGLTIPGGFIFFPENTINERKWEIKIFGDDGNICKDIAREVSSALASHSFIEEIIINFKIKSKKILIKPDRDKLAETGLTFYKTADYVRRAVHGPVVYKRTSKFGETDVIIRLNNVEYYLPTKDQAKNIIIPTSYNKELINNKFKIEEITSITEEYDDSSIKREDRRRMESLTITTEPMDARNVKKQIEHILDNLPIPKGYSIEFDPEAIKETEKMNDIFIQFICAILFCFIILCSVHESFKLPIILILSIFPSLSFPIICFAIFGYQFNAISASAIIAVSGMIINSSILCVSSIEIYKNIVNKTTDFKIFFALRNIITTLIATTTTTIAGAIPLIFLKEQANFLVKIMALISTVGIISSFIFAISFVPALMVLKLKIENYKK